MSHEQTVQRVVLIDSLPRAYIDVMFADADGGYVVAADDARIRELRGEGISVAIMYEDGNEYAGEVYGKSQQEAAALVRGKRQTALSGLPADQQSRFRRPQA